jgi:hypothetical protein
LTFGIDPSVIRDDDDDDDKQCLDHIPIASMPHPKTITLIAAHPPRPMATSSSHASSHPDDGGAVDTDGVPVADDAAIVDVAPHVQRSRAWVIAAIRAP